MRLIFQPVILLALILSLLTPSFSFAASEEAATAAQIKALQKSVRQLTATLNETKGDKKSVQGELRGIDKKIGKLAKQIGTLNKQLGGAEAKLKKLQASRKPILASLREQARGLETQLKQQYKTGKLPRLQLLLTQRDPEQVSRMLQYYDRINQTMTDKLQRFRDDLVQLDQAEQAIRSTQQTVFDRRDALQVSATELKSSRGERKQVLAKLEKQLKAGSRKLKNLKADQQRLEKVLAQLQISINEVALGGNDRAFSELKGRLPWPVKGTLTRGFGSMREGVRFDGVILAAKQGRAVKSIHHGRVVFSDWLRGYGLLLIIDHGGGYMTMYGQADSLLKDVGEWVSAKETVATVGNSGGNSKPSLFFALRYKGKARNPKQWLVKR
ncbi:murein hydrolase activator EnvC family protein [Aliamphritea ceti]|uniref:murein hydrolase activator EnvC family protein n=1 Tax=Aliamphritea ceti TaxID=1524258 RepID=UPI0021C255C3|nr:peptidoglycan DD-metalloendopeptidase family protein [Aliamphritea ceti]